MPSVYWYFSAYWMSDNIHCELCHVFFHCFLVFFVVVAALSGHIKNSLISHQISRAEHGFSNPTSYEEVCTSESGSGMEDERTLPDVILDDLANRRFQVRKRPGSFVSKTTSPNSCPQIFSPDTLAPGLFTLKSEIDLSDMCLSWI
jgi:hypothetical protein